jgi:hypothetical protein
VLGFRCKLLERQVSVWPRQKLNLNAKPSFQADLFLALLSRSSQRPQFLQLRVQRSSMLGPI